MPSSCPPSARLQDALLLAFRRVRRIRATRIMLPSSRPAAVCYSSYVSGRTASDLGEIFRSAPGCILCRRQVYVSHASNVQLRVSLNVCSVISIFLITEQATERELQTEPQLKADSQTRDHTQHLSLRNHFMVRTVFAALFSSNTFISYVASHLLYAARREQEKASRESRRLAR